MLKLQRPVPIPDVQMSQSSLKKVKDDFAAPVKIVKATKQDLVERKMNPSQQRKYQPLPKEASDDSYSEDEVVDDDLSDDDAADQKL